MKSHIRSYLIFVGFLVLTRVVVAPIVNPMIPRKADGKPLLGIQL